MASRLQHSVAAIKRMAEMRRARLQMYIEGEFPDRYVYDKIARTVCGSSWDYVIITPREFPPGFAGDGKQCLRTFYELMRRKKLLRIRTKMHEAVSVFVFDKDIDDVKRIRCRSPHAIYTTAYDIEGHIFTGADLIEATSALLNESRAKVSQVISDQDDWIASATERWRDWVKISATASIFQVRGYVGYSSYSRVHSDYSSLADTTLLTQELARLKQGLSLSPADADSKFDRVSRIVDRRYAEGRALSVFKGKWFAAILEKDLKAAGLMKSPLKGPFARHIISHLMLSLNANSPWAHFIYLPLKDLLAGIGASPHVPRPRSTTPIESDLRASVR